MAASVYRTVRPVNRTGSPLMRKRSLLRRLGVLEVPFPQLRAAAHHCGGALNDAFVAGVAGGLRRYHEKHGVAVGDLHLTMPMSLREEGDEMGGNRITLMRFDVPVGVADPAERIRQIHERTDRVRHEKSLPYTQWIAGALNMMPRWYIGSILRHVDFLCSDVPGIPVPVFLGGARVVTQYAFGPTIGSARNVTLLTYVDVCTLGIDVDTARDSSIMTCSSSASSPVSTRCWRLPRPTPDDTVLLRKLLPGAGVSERGHWDADPLPATPLREVVTDLNGRPLR